MTAIILQPAGGPSARRHYVDTMEQPVPLARMRPHLDPADLAHLEQVYGTNPIPVWGVTPGQGRIHVPKWQRIQPGDVALFARDSRIIASASVSHKAHSPQLARELWDVDVGDHRKPGKMISELRG